MATDKTFTVAGVSTLNGDCKIRFANDVLRVKNLAKSGHEDIRLVELNEAMLKVLPRQVYTITVQFLKMQDKKHRRLPQYYNLKILLLIIF